MFALRRYPIAFLYLTFVMTVLAVSRVVVETAGAAEMATFERLIKLGCDYAQGEQIAPPMDEPALVAWIGKIRAASS